LREVIADLIQLLGRESALCLLHVKNGTFKHCDSALIQIHCSFLESFQEPSSVTIGLSKLGSDPRRPAERGS
jgi:hypothetical protein